MRAGSVQRLILWLASCAAVVRAYETSYLAYRVDHAAVPGDSLLHYNALMWWWRFGDSPRGFTLTPSPSFIDLAIQLPIALAAPDFERFSYGLALAYALLIFASLWAVLRVVLGGAALAAVVAAAIVAAFYLRSPIDLAIHAFMYNHTSEVFSTLGVVALLHALYRPGAPRRRLAPWLYALAVAASVISSPFFIATYCIPASFAVLALLGTPYVSWRRLLWFGGITAVAAFAGLVALSAISLYVWPIRGDHYLLTGKQSYELFRHTLLGVPGVGYAMLATAVAAVASIALVAVGRRTRRIAEPTIFMLAFLAASALSCTILPMKRGALGGSYQMRYLQLPWLLAIAFYAVVAVLVARALVARLPRRGPPWLAWAGAAAAGAAALALAITLRGPLTMHDPASTTAPMIACVQAAEKTGLHDGLATNHLARFLNAAMHADDWRSPNAITQIYSGLPPEVMAAEGNALWYDGAYRGGRAKLNYLITQSLDDNVLASVRQWIGAPDRTMTCPAPVDLRVDGKPTFDLWIWDRDEPQRLLAELVTRDNLRGAFVPVVGNTRIAIDPVWGMSSSAGELVGRRRVWRRAAHPEGISMALVRSFYLPSGVYRAELDMTSVPRAGATGPVAEIFVEMERRRPIRHVLVRAGMTRVTYEFTVRNLGGPTSGDLMWMNVIPWEAESIEITGLTITLVDPRAIDPFKIFH